MTFVAAHYRDNGTENLRVPLVAMKTCYYPMTDHFFAVIDGIFWMKELKRIYRLKIYIPNTMIRNKQERFT